MDFSAVPTGVDLAPENIERIFDRVDETTTALTKRINTFSGQVIEAADRFRAQHEPMLKNALSDDKPTIRAHVNRQVERETNEYRRNIVDSTEKERQQILDAMSKQERDALALAELYPSPEAMLTRIGLGTTQHAAYVSTLTGAGQVELEQRAREALMTNNRVLASAMVTVIDRIRPRSKRPFSVAEFAAAAVGDEHKALLAKFSDMKQRLSAARDLDREFVTGKSDPLSKVARGLVARQATGA